MNCLLKHDERISKKMLLEQHHREKALSTCGLTTSYFPIKYLTQLLKLFHQHYLWTYSSATTLTFWIYQRPENCQLTETTGTAWQANTWPTCFPPKGVCAGTQLQKTKMGAYHSHSTDGPGVLFQTTEDIVWKRHTIRSSSTRGHS